MICIRIIVIQSYLYDLEMGVQIKYKNAVTIWAGGDPETVLLTITGHRIEGQIG